MPHSKPKAVNLNDLQALLAKLQEDLRTRCAERPEVETPLRAQYEAARAAKRTAEAYESWREDQFAQATVAWILSCVFIRFLEDNGLLGDAAYLSGPGPRLALARDQHTLYFRQHPTESDREYLYHVFRTVRGLPGMGPLFDGTHNPVWRLGLSGDGAQLLLEFWQKLNAEAGQDQEHAPLVHDFSDPNLETRFLGDLYQDLSDEAKKRYALLQTPEFIEEFILDRTLTPAIETFGYPERSGQVLPVVVFTDGFMFHVEGENCRIGKDMAQRMAIARSGRFHVWSLTWDDIEDKFTAQQQSPFENLLAYSPGNLGKLLAARKLNWMLGFYETRNFDLLVQFLAAPAAEPWRGYAAVSALNIGPPALVSEEAAQAAQSAILGGGIHCCQQHSLPEL